MSFLKDIIAKEEIEVLAEGQVEEVIDSEAVEAAEAAEEARQEANATAEEAQRAEAVVDELESQNEAITAIVEEKGELTPEEAAGFEAARRASVAGLGIDPDGEGLASEVVDEAGLESMVVGHGVLALEQNQTAIQKLIAGAKQLWEAFLEKVKSFFRWLGKIFSFMDKKYKAAYSAVNSMDEAEFQAKLEKAQKWWDSADVKTLKNFMDDNGKLLDVHKEAGAAFDKLDKVASEGTKVIQKHFTEGNKFRAFCVPGFRQDMNEVMEKAGTIEFGTYSYTFKKEGKLVGKFDTKEKQAKAKGKLNISKGELAKFIQNGSATIKMLDQWNARNQKNKDDNDKLIKSFYGVGDQAKAKAEENKSALGKIIAYSTLGAAGVGASAAAYANQAAIANSASTAAATATKGLAALGSEVSTLIAKGAGWTSMQFNGTFVGAVDALKVYAKLQALDPTVVGASTAAIVMALAGAGIYFGVKAMNKGISEATRANGVLFKAQSDITKNVNAALNSGLNLVNKFTGVAAAE